MALQTKVYTTTVNHYTLELTVTEDSISGTGNTSALSFVLKLKSGGYDFAQYGVGASVSLNGTQVAYRDRYNSPQLSIGTYSEITLLSGTTTVAHDSGGGKTIAVAATLDMAKAYYTPGPMSLSGSMALTGIDRAAPTVSFSTSDITQSSITISASANAACNIWQYSLNGGSSWTTFSTSNVTSAKTTLTGLSANTTYNLRVRARKTYNNIYGTSSTVPVTTLGGAILQSVNDMYVDTASAALTFKWQIYISSYYHRLTVSVGSQTLFTISGLTGSVGSGTKTVQLTSAQLTALKNATVNSAQTTATYTLRTYTDSSYATQIGNSSTQTAKLLTSAANSAPEFSTSEHFTYADTNTATAAITGNNQYFIKGHSILSVTVPAATAKNGASIVSYEVSAESVKKSFSSPGTLNFGVLNNQGEIGVTVTVKDSRGYTVSDTKNVTVINYNAIKITDWSMRRTNEVEETVELSFEGDMSPIYVDSGAKNAITSAAYRYRLASSDTYGSWIDIDVASTNYSFSFSTEDLGTTFDPDNAYYLEIKVADRITSSTVSDLYLPIGTPLMSFRSKKVGINTPTPEHALDVNGDARFEGPVEFLESADFKGELLKNGKPMFPVDSLQSMTGATMRYQSSAALSVPEIDYIAGFKDSNTLAPIGGGNVRQFLKVPYCISDGNYYGLGLPDGTTNAYLRAPQQGIIPYKSGGNGYLGTSGWPWIAIYGNAVYAPTLGWTTLWSGTLSSGSITVTNGRKYAAIIVGGIPGSGESYVSACLPCGQWGTLQLASNLYYISYNVGESGNNLTISVVSNPSGGSIRQVWGIVRYQA